MQSNIARFAIFGTLALVGGGAFVANIANQESAKCGDSFNGFNNELGVCSPKGDAMDNLIIVAGNTANSPAPSIEKDTKAYEFVSTSLANAANIKIISAASDLALIPTQSEFKITNKTNNAEGFLNGLNEVINDINTSLATPPTANGANYYEAIMKAVRDLNSTRSDKTKTGILVIGSGLSDGGTLNFADSDLLERDYTDVLKSFRPIEGSMSELKIYWSGIGQTTAPQADLSLNPELIDNLKNTYKGVFTKNGLTDKNLYFDDSVRNAKSINTEYKVKPVGIKVFEINDEYFKPGTAELLNPDKTTTNLAGIVDKAKRYANTNIIVTGYMAAGECTNEKVDTSLAGQRAEAIKQQLISQGIEQRRIQIENGGVFQPEISECQNGQWLEELAKSKRKVIINFE